MLDATRSLAEGFTLVAAHGIESESVLAHAGLLELVTPLRRFLDEVPTPQADALRTALGWASPGAPADPFLVAAATLSLLAAAAERAPVLVTVDDLQWLDRESTGAILFAARRLGQDAVAFAFSARTGAIPRDALRGIPVLALTGLSPAAASRLVPRSATDAVLARLVADTDGNPLALLEVSQRLDSAQWVGAAPLPNPLPVGDRLLDFYQALLTEMSADAWRAVVLFALEQSADSTTVAATLAMDGGDPAAALDEARQGGILVRDDLGLRFRHPLLRTAVLRLATPAQQRAAHLALAAHLPPHSPARWWHLAEGSTGPDDALADELARVAASDRDRLGFRRRLRRVGAVRPAHPRQRPGHRAPRGGGRGRVRRRRRDPHPRARGPGARRRRADAGARAGPVHARDARAVRRFGPAVHRVSVRSLRPARGSAAGPRAGGVGPGGVPAQPLRDHPRVRRPDRRRGR